MTIRDRLILMLTVPLLALVLVAAFGFSQLSAESEDHEDARETTIETTLVDRIGRNIGSERLGFVSGVSASALAEFEEATDASIEAAVSIGSAEVAGLAEAVQTAVVESRTGSSSQRLEQYRGALDLVDGFTDSRSRAGFSPDAISVFDGLRGARVAADLQEESWFFALDVADASPGTVAELARRFANAEDGASDVSAATTESGRRLFESPTQSDTAQELLAFERIVLRDAIGGEVPVVDSVEVFELLSQNRAEWTAAGQNAETFLQTDIEDRANSTDSSRSLFVFLALLGAFLLAVLIFVISRSIVGPLSRLIAEAEAVTTVRLPRAVAELRRVGADDAPPEVRPIARETDDEIGALVDAFNSVQGTAMQVSVEQARSRRNVAEMFVSLGRRNQQLNHRMLGLISDLERDEQDPAVLQGLYQLDHMATRMRRNAESLLVLAGNRSPRQWSRPVAAEDILRSAIAEVENFERIEIGDVPNIAFRGSVVTDVTHLLAELLDNATSFSDPSSVVTMSAFETNQGVEIEISDTGLGITEDDLAALNNRIADPPALDEAPSRLLGLFVVGRLAQEHDIDVRLESQPGVGTVARVSLPEAMIPSDTVQGPTPLQPAESNAGVGEQVRAELGFDTDSNGLEAPIPGDLEGDTWAAAATYEAELADAAVPTVDEMEEALTSFPTVAIDAVDSPAMPAPVAPAVASELPPVDPSAAGWPLNAVDSPDPDLPVRELHDRSVPAAASATPAAPEPVVDVRQPQLLNLWSPTPLVIFLASSTSHLHCRSSMSHRRLSRPRRRPNPQWRCLLR